MKQKIDAWKDRANRLPLPVWGLPMLIGLLSLSLLIQNNALPAGPESTIAKSENITQNHRNRPPVATPVYEPLSGAELAALEPVNNRPLPAPTRIKATPTPEPPTPTPIFVFHTVRPEDTLISIASKYGVTTEALLAANEIRDPTRLEAGQQLLIPPSDGLRVPIVPHKIEADDTLVSIASRYNSSVKDILAANPHLTPDSLRVGEVVAVPIIFTEFKSVSQIEGDSLFHIVQPGDIPLLIAEEYNIPVEVLLAVNEVTDPTLLQVGQQLLIPPDEGLTLGAPMILHELEAGDTLLGLATKYGSSVKDILAANPDLVPASLEVGQTVAVPAIFAPPKLPAPPGAPDPEPIPAPPAVVNLEQQMIEVINARRQAEGLSPYQADAELTRVAVAHAQDMVVRDYFSHFTPEGLSPRDRFRDHGVNTVYNVGENIQRNTRSENETVPFALEWFMNSGPHRQNILHQTHNRIGVGIVEGPPGWYTLVLDFAQR